MFIVSIVVLYQCAHFILFLMSISTG